MTKTHLKPEKLYKTTIVIWSEFPTEGLELEDLARDADIGDSYCDGLRCEEVTDPAQFPNTDFFGMTAEW